MSRKSRSHPSIQEMMEKTGTPLIPAPIPTVQEIEEALRLHSKETNLFGASLNMLEAQCALHEASGSARHILITGPTGTGKEVLAQEIMRLSKVSKGKCRSVNCAAINPNLIESELFGHVKGAFSDAVCDKVGLFEKADGGVFFFDEIGTIPKYIQAKILRVAQEKEFYKVGSEDPIRLKESTRIIAATNKPKKLRKDLLFRFPVHVCFLPLRKRPSDLFVVLYGMFESLRQSRGIP